MKVNTYIKKPIQIKAVQYLTSNLSDIVSFLGDFPHTVVASEQMLIIHTLEGEHLVRHGDYVVRGPYDEYYPVKPTIFEETYEKVTINQ